MTATPLQAGRNGFVGEFLAGLGIPTELAFAVGSAVVFVGVCVASYAVGRVVVVPAVTSTLDARDVDAHVRKPITLLLYGGVGFAGVSLAFALAGYGNILIALSTVAAAATLAVGFAVQDVIKNFVAGAFIYADRPFRTGDWIEWEGNSGYVEEIGLRVSRVRTFDNEHLTVPNSQLTDGVIRNYDRNGTLRLKFDFRIGFDDDIDQARAIILEEARRAAGVLAEPEPSVKLVEINEASFGLQSRIWIDDPGNTDFLGIRGRFVQAVTERFEREGITVPYPHRSVDGQLDGVGSAAGREP